MILCVSSKDENTTHSECNFQRNTNNNKHLSLTHSLSLFLLYFTPPPTGTTALIFVVGEEGDIEVGIEVVGSVGEESLFFFSIAMVAMVKVNCSKSEEIAKT